jgi:hypothetical protein
MRFGAERSQGERLAVVARLPSRYSLRSRDVLCRSELGARETRSRWAAGHSAWLTCEMRTRINHRCSSWRKRERSGCGQLVQRRAGHIGFRISVRLWLAARPTSLFLGGSFFSLADDFSLDFGPQRAEPSNDETYKRPDEKTFEGVEDDSVAA